ncbi:MAG: alpha-E domain-containing protein [Burkholderiales bacterium]|nr:alpha-E domain-containing protein [Burkholderiales bacterium]
MLSRTASNLYWMARYLERAELTTRLLAACFQPGLPFDGEEKKLVELPLKIQGVYEEYVSLHGTNVTREKVQEFLISGLSRSSVKSCLESARENARSERGKLSSEMWETINQTWIEFKGMQHKPLVEFTDWIKQRAFAVQGTIYITMPVNFSRYFVRLGVFLESADQTLRILEAKCVLRELSNQSDAYHWHMLLRAVSSYEAFQQNVIGTPSADNVFEFLLFHKALPRSVRYCIEYVYQTIQAIGGNNNDSLKAIAQLLVKLKYDHIDDVLAVGQEEYIHMLQTEILQVSNKINQGYFITA